MWVIVMPLAWFLFRLDSQQPCELDGGLAPAPGEPVLAAAPSRLWPLRRQLLSRPFPAACRGIPSARRRDARVLINPSGDCSRIRGAGAHAAQLLSLQVFA